ncbi:rhodanese [Methylobacterium sp. C25]|uniref:rhodanese-like domain-containing protein n=1 Tax=Methylobacterium sp. C25 TaxID=2721622 RepID=UPI001F3F5511|nr:rhodanese-like domain-containing protein [Methylobacterium sp. C25]MCE4223694.1 rhodanese [Methylobacterium sp. C25]
MARTDLRRAVGVTVLATLAGLLVAAAPADSPVNVPEPQDLYDGPQHGYTPETLKGATVVNLAGLDKLIANDKPLLLDVVLADRKPEGLPPGTLWLPSHRSIPGAVWLPGAGVVPLTPEQQAAFFKRIEELTGGDKSKPIVTFCRPECWGSWNAGKRLIGAGYSRIYWWPLGVEGWQDTHDTSVVEADKAWTASTKEKAPPPVAPQH